MNSVVLIENIVVYVIVYQSVAINNQIIMKKDLE